MFRKTSKYKLLTWERPTASNDMLLNLQAVTQDEVSPFRYNQTGSAGELPSILCGKQKPGMELWVSPNTVSANLQAVSRVDLKCSNQEKERARIWYDAGVRYGGNHVLVYQINPLYILDSHMLYVNYLSMKLENENTKRVDALWIF